MDSGLQESEEVLATSKNKSKAASMYWDRIEIIFKTFRFLGYIPYKTVTMTGEIDSSLRTWLWAVFIILVQVALNIKGNSMRLDQKYWDTYDKTLESLIRMLFTNTTVFLVPFIWENYKILKYVNGWRAFLEKLNSETMTPVTCFNKYQLKWLFITITLGTMFVVLVDQITLQGEFGAFLYVFYFIGVYVSALITIFWTSSCFFIVQVARCLNDNLFIELSTNANPTLIDRYRLLWLQLRLIAIHFPEVFKGPIGLHLFTNSLSLVFSIYTWATAVKHAKDVYRIIGLINPIVWNSVTLFVICEFSDMVSREIGQNLTEKMLSLNLSTQDHGIQQTDEIDLLLDTFDGNSTKLMLHGCLTIDRSLLITILSSSLTYIIVLLQFDVNVK